MKPWQINTKCTSKFLFTSLIFLMVWVRRTYQIQFKQSPCPLSFVYEPADEDDRYYGIINLKINQTADTASFRITLDKPAQLLVIKSFLKVNERSDERINSDNAEDSWSSPTTSTDNKVFISYDGDAVLKQGFTYSGRIMVKFDKKKPIPMLESIYLNAVKVCPSDPVVLSSSNTDSYTTQSRPDPDFNSNNDNGQRTSSTQKYTTSFTTRSTSRPSTGRPDPEYNSNSATGTTRRPTQATRYTTESNSNANSEFRPDPNYNSNTDTTTKKATQRPSTNTNAVTSRPNTSRPSSASNGGGNGNFGTNNGNSNSIQGETNTQVSHNINEGYGSSSGTLNQGNVNSNSAGTVPCGSVSIANPLVTGGQKAHHGQWPWHIALYKTEGVNLNYLCGGSLISKNKVITAAHCLISNPGNKIISFKNLIVYLGKYNLRQYTEETGVQTREVMRLNINPTYNSSNFAGDIAILTLSSDVEYTNYVRPVCTWEAEDGSDDIVGEEGVVAGWGLTEYEQTSEELKMATLPVVSTETCFRSNQRFYSEYLSETAFCAGFRNGTSPCNGDSGGGLVFERNRNNWYLRGIVSLSVAKEGLNFCDPKYYVIFTDTARYVHFIKQNL